MANETEKTILPYLNVLEVETIDKSNVTKVIVIDKDDEVKVMDGSQLATNSYFDLQDKPEINSIELNGNMTSEELGLASSEDIVTINSELEQIKSTIPSAENIDNQITERLADYPTKEEVTTEISDAVANKADKSEIPTKTSQLTNDSGFISSLDGYATEKWVEDNYLTKEATESALNSKQNKLNQGDGIVIEENTVSADYNTIRNKPSLNGTELSGAASIVPAINIQSVPSKVTLAPVFGNQTGEAVELPIYNTETNQAGIVNGPLYAQLADKYTKAEIDALNTAINKEIASKQETLTAGKNISIIDNVISAFENHFLLNLDENDPVRQKHIYDFIRTNLDFYLFCQITYKGDIIVIPVATIEHPETIDLYGYYFQDNGVLVVINAILVNNGNMTVKVTEVDLTNKGYTKDEVDEKLAAKQGVFTPQAPLAFNEDKSQLSVDLSGYQPVGDYATNDSVNEEIETLRSSLQSKIDAKQDKGDYALKSDIPTKVSELTNDSNFVTEAEVSGDLAGKADKTYVDEQLATKQPVGDYALKSDIPTKVSELTNDSNFVTEAEVSGDLAGKADKTYVDEQLATKQPVGDYATKTELAGKADSSVVESLSTQVATNTSDISIIKTKQEEDGDKIDSLDKEMATKQDLLVSGTNIKTINSQSLLGEGNIEIESGSNIPFLFINSTTHLSGDFAAVKNAIANKTPFELYYVNILGYGDIAAPEVCFVSGENIQATFHFESTTANHTVVQTTITPTGVSADTSYHSYQEQLVSGTNIKTINGESILGEGNLEISGSGGTTDYTQLTNKPQINSVELSGNKSLSDLGIQPAGNYIEAGTGTQPQINTITVLTQAEYDRLSTKDPNTQYLIIE